MPPAFLHSCSHGILHSLSIASRYITSTHNIFLYDVDDTIDIRFPIAEENWEEEVVRIGLGFFV